MEQQPPHKLNRAPRGSKTLVPALLGVCSQPYKATLRVTHLLQKASPKAVPWVSFCVRIPRIPAQEMVPGWFADEVVCECDRCCDSAQAMGHFQTPK